jgi:hypothetical protein
VKFRQGFVAGGLAVWLALRLMERWGKNTIVSRSEARARWLAGLDHDKMLVLNRAIQTELARRQRN